MEESTTGSQLQTGVRSFKPPPRYLKLTGRVVCVIPVDLSEASVELFRVVSKQCPNFPYDELQTIAFVLTSRSFVFCFDVMLSIILGACDEEAIELEVVSNIMVFLQFSDGTTGSIALSIEKVSAGMSIIQSYSGIVLTFYQETLLSDSLLQISETKRDLVDPYSTLNSRAGFSNRWIVLKHELFIVEYCMNEHGLLSKFQRAKSPIPRGAQKLEDLNLDLDGFQYSLEDPFADVYFEKNDQSDIMVCNNQNALSLLKRTVTLDFEAIKKVFFEEPTVTLFRVKKRAGTIAHLEGITSRSDMNESGLYKTIASLNVSDDCTVQVVDHIAHMFLEFQSSRPSQIVSDAPFLFFGGPSRSGKTTMCITLDAFARYKSFEWSGIHGVPQTPMFAFAVPIFMRLEEPDSMQSIYRTFTPSEVFSHCVNIDYAVLQKRNDMEKSVRGVSMDENIAGSKLHSDPNLAFHTVGFLVALLTKMKEGFHFELGTTFEYSPLTLAQGRAIISKLADGLPVIISLDEFNTKNQSLKLPYFLARNILRELNIMVCLSGTDAQASNLLDKRGLGGEDSFAPGGKYPWVSIVTKYPRVTEATVMAILRIQLGVEVNITSLSGYLDLFRINQELKTWLLDLNSSLPGFVRIFFTHFHRFAMESHLKQSGRRLSASELNRRSLELLDNSLQASAIDLFNRKKILSTTSGILGQFLMLFSRNRRRRQIRNSADLIHGHFADLVLYVQLSTTLDVSPYNLPVAIRNRPLYERLDRGYFVDARRSKGDTNHSLLLSTNTEIDLLIPYSSSQLPVHFFSMFPEYALNELYYLILSSFLRTELDHLRAHVLNITFGFYENTGVTPSGMNSYRANSPRYGSFLETASTGAMIVRSQYSLSGTPFREYVRGLAQEFMPNLKRFEIDYIPIVDTEDGLSTCLVPYFASAGATSTRNFRNLPGVYTGTYLDTVNASECDGVFVPDEFLELGEALANRAPKYLDSDLKFHRKEGKDYIGGIKEDKLTEDAVGKVPFLPSADKFMLKYWIAANHLDHFVGFMFVSKLANMTEDTWSSLRNKYPVLRVLIIGKGSAELILEGETRFGKKLRDDIRCSAPLIIVFETESLSGRPLHIEKYVECDIDDEVEND